MFSLVCSVLVFVFARYCHFRFYFIFIFHCFKYTGWILFWFLNLFCLSFHSLCFFCITEFGKYLIFVIDVLDLFLILDLNSFFCVLVVVKIRCLYYATGLFLNREFYELVCCLCYFCLSIFFECLLVVVVVIVLLLFLSYIVCRVKVYII